MRRPQLTAKIVEALETMAPYADADAADMDDQPETQGAFYDACEYIEQLGRWYRQQKRKTSNRRKP